jgi:hypothetical protein
MIMSNTVILILFAVVVIGGIVSLVIYSGRRGEQHRQKTTIKPRDPRRERHTGR